MKPAWSPTATVDTPSFASSIAACDPTLPKPSVAIVAPARSKPCSSAHWRITCTIPWPDARSRPSIPPLATGLPVTTAFAASAIWLPMVFA